MNDLVSVIVPIYKVEEDLSRCVDSILAQTYKELEIILVDDGSPDACGQICDEYAVKDNRIRVIHKENAGVGQARNTGVEACNGKYIMFVDSDDFLERNAIQVLYEKLVADGSDMAVGRHADYYSDGRRVDSCCSRMTDAVVTATHMFETIGEINYVPVACWCKLYQKELFADVRFPELRCGEDLLVYLQVLDRCKQISVVNETLYFYFQRISSLMHGKSEEVKCEELEATLQAVRFLWQRDYQESARRWFARGISRAMLFSDKKRAAALFRQYLDRRERWELFKKLQLKEQIKWMTLFVPAVNVLYENVKHVLKRG